MSIVKIYQEPFAEGEMPQMIHKNRDISVQITSELKRLREEEPPVTAQRLVQRTNIMGFELGDIQHFTTVNTQENMDPIIKNGWAAQAQLGMADLITQCRMLCLDLDWNFDRIQLMGLQHLQERHSDFEKEGYGSTITEVTQPKKDLEE